MLNHPRAPPDIRGSGKERGHGTELTHCPKCGKGLKPGKHHVGCSGGKAGARQNKRTKAVRPAKGADSVALHVSSIGVWQCMPQEAWPHAPLAPLRSLEALAAQQQLLLLPACISPSPCTQTHPLMYWVTGCAHTCRLGATLQLLLRAQQQWRA